MKILGGFPLVAPHAFDPAHRALHPTPPQSSLTTFVNDHEGTRAPGGGATGGYASGGVAPGKRTMTASLLPSKRPPAAVAPQTGDNGRASSATSIADPFGFFTTPTLSYPKTVHLGEIKVGENVSDYLRVSSEDGREIRVIANEPPSGFGLSVSQPRDQTFRNSDPELLGLRSPKIVWIPEKPGPLKATITLTVVFNDGHDPETISIELVGEAYKGDVAPSKRRADEAVAAHNAQAAAAAAARTAQDATVTARGAAAFRDSLQTPSDDQAHRSLVANHPGAGNVPETGWESLSPETQETYEQEMRTLIAKIQPTVAGGSAQGVIGINEAQLKALHSEAVPPHDPDSVLKDIFAAAVGLAVGGFFDKFLDVGKLVSGAPLAIAKWVKDEGKKRVKSTAQSGLAGAKDSQGASANETINFFGTAARALSEASTHIQRALAEDFESRVASELRVKPEATLEALRAMDEAFLNHLETAADTARDNAVVQWLDYLRKRSLTGKNFGLLSQVKEKKSADGGELEDLLAGRLLSPDHSNPFEYRAVQGVVDIQYELQIAPDVVDTTYAIGAPDYDLEAQDPDQMLSLVSFQEVTVGGVTPEMMEPFSDKTIGELLDAGFTVRVAPKIIGGAAVVLRGDKTTYIGGNHRGVSFLANLDPEYTDGFNPTSANEQRGADAFRKFLLGKNFGNMGLRLQTDRRSK